MFFLNGAFAWQVYLASLFLALGSSHFIFKRYGKLAAATFFWMAFSALQVYTNPISPFSAEEPLWRISLELSAASTLVMLFLQLLVAPMLTPSLIQIFGLVSAAAIILRVPDTGILLNASMNGCLCACLFPLYKNKYLKWFVALGAVASLKSQPIGILFLMLCLRHVNRGYFKKAIGMIGLGLCVGIAAKGSLFFNSSGRTIVWKDALDFFIAHANPFTGMGLGSFYYIGPFITLEKFKQGFIWLHSDWMQIGFETGIVGLILSASLYAQALALSTRKTFAPLVAFGLFGIANFPLHNPVSALIFTYFMHTSLVKQVLPSLEPDCKLHSSSQGLLQKPVHWRHRFFAKCKLVAASL